MSREQTQQAYKAIVRWFSQSKSPTISSPISSNLVRRVLLLSATVLGTLGAALVSSRLPTLFEAEASFLVGSCEEGLPATSLLTDDVVARSLEDVAWTGPDRPSIEVLIQSAMPDRHQVTCVVRCDHPSDAAALSLACAKNLAAGPFGQPPTPIESTSLSSARENLMMAESRYRAALADWGQDATAMPTDVHSDEPILVQTRGSADEKDVFTAPAMLSKERTEQKNLIESALEECHSQRQRLADLYTTEHPAVIALDRQILHLQSLQTEKTTTSPSLPKSSTIQKTGHQMPATAGRDADVNARRELVEQLALARQQAQQELQRVEARARPINSPLPEVLSEVVSGPRPLRSVGSTRSSFFVGCTSLILVAVCLVEVMALYRRRLVVLS
ncbi:hypothetical protein K2X85_00355 [bacterium]|nr:hypothetical protein [bacterium]